MAKFSRRFHVNTLHERYNSCEVGAKIAASLLEIVDPLHGIVKGGDAPPKFLLPRVLSRGALLPGNLRFFFAEMPEYDRDDMRVVSTNPVFENGEIRYCKVRLDKYGRVVMIVYIGHKCAAFNNMEKLVGMHETYINSLISTYDRGDITDLLSYFEGEWAAALYHDRFRECCLDIRSALLDDDFVANVLGKLKSTGPQIIASIDLAGTREDGLPSSTRQLIERCLLRFLRSNSEMLDMYFPI